MLTVDIISTWYKGIKLQAIGSYGCKYTQVVITNDGKLWYYGCRTIRDANDYFVSHQEIKKMVLYIYHRKKQEFEVRKYYER